MDHSKPFYYIPKAFNISELAVTIDFISKYSFAQVISIGSHNTPLISRIPLVLTSKASLFSSLTDHQTSDYSKISSVDDLKQNYVLVGHLAYANLHWKSLYESPDQLITVIFSGPHSYISPLWYEKYDVPTWNYSEVRAYGRVSFITDTKAQRKVLEQLVDKNEHEWHPENPWKLSALEDSYVEDKMKKIKFFQIEIQDIETKFKMFQNRSEADQQGVIQNLEGTETGKFMKELKDKSQQ